ncbi:hypothetical protein B0H14DRAFT_2725213, partial [Mycena olivaceomarginata]
MQRARVLWQLIWCRARCCPTRSQERLPTDALAMADSPNTTIVGAVSHSALGAVTRDRDQNSSRHRGDEKENTCPQKRALWWCKKAQNGLHKRSIGCIYGDHITTHHGHIH